MLQDCLRKRPFIRPDTQADAGASRIASDHPVTSFLDEPGEGTHSLCDEPVISPSQFVVLQSSFESNRDPFREEQEALARRCDIGLEQTYEWFTYWNHQNNECKRSSEQGDEGKKRWKGFTCGEEGRLAPSSVVPGGMSFNCCRVACGNAPSYARHAS